MSKTCGCVPGDDILLGPNRPGPTSHRFDVVDAPVQVRLLGDDADLEEVCIQIYSTAEVCGEEFVTPASRGCCEMFLDCLQRSLTIAEPGRYFVMTDADSVESFVVQARKFPAAVTLTMDIGGHCE